MTAITWHNVGSKQYETGVDRGVLYDPDGIGVPWNGLISVVESHDDNVEPIHYDSIKINDIVTKGDFSGTMSAFTYPEEFHKFEGTIEDQSGVFVTGQPPKRFNLCYRSKVSNDQTEDAGYKIHLLYNLTAIPEDRERRTLGLDVEPLVFSWNLTSIPERIFGHRPTAHLILDSRQIDSWLLIDIESILYGDEENDPTMPSMQAFLTFIRKWDRMIIVDNGDGTWSVITLDDDLITMISPTEFEFDAENADYLDDDTYEVSSSDKNAEDV